jgi:plastocyanin
MRTRLLLVPLATLMACGGGSDGTPTGPGGGGGGGAAPTVTTSVEMTGNKFSPSAIRVAPGATVTFTNSDGLDHNVIFANTAVANIAAFPSGSRTTVMPTAAATYSYSCTLHAGMNGTIQVQ